MPSSPLPRGGEGAATRALPNSANSLSPPRDSTHIVTMANGPDRPQAPHRRDPAKHSKKDPARPTRAKAARPDTPALDRSLADLLNPGIGQGRAGIGAQTGQAVKRADPPSPPGGKEDRAERDRVRESGSHSQPPSPGPAGRPLPTGERRIDERSGLQPPPDNSWDRRADFAQAHRARASVARGFGEAPKQGYVGRSPVSPGELDPDLARALGIEEEETTDETPAEDRSNRGGVIKYGEEARSRSARSGSLLRGEQSGSAFGSAASQPSP